MRVAAAIQQEEHQAEVRRAEVEPALSEGLRIAVERVARVALPETIQVLGDVLIDVGRSPEVGAFAESLRSPELDDNPYFRAFCGALGARASLDDGRPDEADAAIAEHLIERPWSSDFLSECQLLSYRATVALAEGNPRSAAADLLVTKAGPGTISEACIAGLPMILSDAIPGQEDGNVSYVVENDAGVFAPGPEKVIAAVQEFLEQGPEKLALSAENAKRIARPDAVWEIADEVWDLANQPRIKRVRRSLMPNQMALERLISLSRDQ